jgi:hypothetical protein
MISVAPIDTQYNDNWHRDTQRSNHKCGFLYNSKNVILRAEIRTDRWTDGRTEIQTGRQAGRQADKQTDRRNEHFAIRVMS